MKPEEFIQKCPKCSSVDKFIGRTRQFNEAPHLLETVITCAVPPGGSRGVIRCRECGYIFEYCPQERKLDDLINKIEIDNLKHFNIGQKSD